jgi:hypothetical protein
MQYKLSILIPARNEEWLARTVKDICENKNDFTEVLVGIDGEHTGEEVAPHKDVTIVRVATSIGQRAMTNKLCRMSTAKYVMKTDAHTAWDKDFDAKLIADMQDDWTVVPVMRNLHVFDYVCPQGHRRYQSPSGDCTTCGAPTTKDVVWLAKTNPQSTSYRFDTTMHFQYFNDYKRSNRYRRQLKTGLTETMSLQGSCFMLTRDKYWELNICDEQFGSWGAQAVEVACKTWLSGGKCMVNHKTWYGHLFRTQGGDFGFPYEQDNRQVENARKLSRTLFLDNTWEKQKLPLSWLVDRFAPVPDWHDGKDNGMLEKIRNQPLTMV